MGELDNNFFLWFFYCMWKLFRGCDIFIIVYLIFSTITYDCKLAEKQQSVGRNVVFLGHIILTPLRNKHLNSRHQTGCLPWLSTSLSTPYSTSASCPQHFISTFSLLALGRYFCCWTISARGYHLLSNLGTSMAY